MEDFKHFSKEDSEIIQKELAVLQGMVKREDRLITGYNYYFEYIDPEKLVISISFLHRSDALRKEFESDLNQVDTHCRYFQRKEGRKFLLQEKNVPCIAHFRILTYKEMKNPEI